MNKEDIKPGVAFKHDSDENLIVRTTAKANQIYITTISLSTKKRDEYWWSNANDSIWETSVEKICYSMK